MTKKNYKAIAECIDKVRVAYKDNEVAQKALYSLIGMLCMYFREDNPSFRPPTFIAAAWKEYSDEDTI
jgi:phosphotransferase system IIB component